MMALDLTCGFEYARSCNEDQFFQLSCSRGQCNRHAIKEEEEEEEEERSVTDCQTGGGWEITGVLAQQPTCLITPLSF